MIGAGAAGMMCAAVAGQRGARVLLDRPRRQKLAEKIRISGGGRCNFTNVNAGPASFISENPAFCPSALARYTAADFVALVKRHRIRFHEKHKGQLFCDESSEQIVDLLVAECDAGNVRWMRPVKVERVGREDDLFEVATGEGVQAARCVVIATGGLSIPKIGATDFGYRIARQFGLRIVEPRPALVPLIFDRRSGRPSCRSPASRSRSTLGATAAASTRTCVHASRPVRAGDPAGLELLAAGRGDRTRPRTSVR